MTPAGACADGGRQGQDTAWAHGQKTTPGTGDSRQEAPCGARLAGGVGGDFPPQGLFTGRTVPGLGRWAPPHLPHDGDGRLPSGLSHSVLHQVEHVLVVEQADEVEGAEAGRTAQGQVPDHHGAGQATGAMLEGQSVGLGLAVLTRAGDPRTQAALDLQPVGSSASRSPPPEGTWRGCNLTQEGMGRAGHGIWRSLG